MPSLPRPIVTRSNISVVSAVPQPLPTLMFERVTIGLGSEGMGYNSNRFAEAIAADAEARRDPEVRHQLGEIASELLAVRFTGYRTLSALQKGQVPGPESGL